MSCPRSGPIHAEPDLQQDIVLDFKGFVLSSVFHHLLVEVRDGEFNE